MADMTCSQCHQEINDSIAYRLHNGELVCTDCMYALGLEMLKSPQTDAEWDLQQWFWNALEEYIAEPFFVDDCREEER